MYRFFCLFTLCVTLVIAIPAERKYTAKFDNIDVDKILNNNRLLSSYIKCMMEEGPCTNEGNTLKETLPDALSTGCTKCSEKQKTLTEKVITHLMNNRKKDWDRLSRKYDPKGDFQKKYEHLLKNKPMTA